MNVETANYHDADINSLWHDLAEGYFNFGIINPDKNGSTTLKQANDDMVDYIITKLAITSDSFLLDQVFFKFSFAKLF